MHTGAGESGIRLVEAGTYRQSATVILVAGSYLQQCRDRHLPPLPICSVHDATRVGVVESRPGLVCLLWPNTAI